MCANEMCDYDWQKYIYNTNTYTHFWQILLDSSIMIVSPRNVTNSLNAIGSNSFLNLSAIISFIL